MVVERGMSYTLCKKGGGLSGREREMSGGSCPGTEYVPGECPVPDYRPTLWCGKC